MSTLIEIDHEAFRTAIGGERAKAIRDQIIDLMHEFAHATGSEPGTCVIQHFKEVEDRAVEAARDAVAEARMK